MATKKTPTPTEDANRSSKTGRFVTEDFAKKHPSTTEHEKIKHPKK